MLYYNVLKSESKSENLNQMLPEWERNSDCSDHIPNKEEPLSQAT